MLRDHKKKVAALALAIPMVASFEGVRQYVYRDPVGIPTFCFGETRNPEWGKRYSMDECKTLLGNRLNEFSVGLDRCLMVEVGPHRYAALLSFSYNVGTSAACSSSVIRRINAGQGASACDGLLAWNKAKGIALPGLTRRRKEEAEMCRRED